MLLQLICEDKIVKPIANKQEAPSEDHVEDVIPDDVLAKTFESLINDLIQDAWGLISSTNSAITSIDFEYSKEDKADIIELLNSIVDDTTISIGVLYKVSELINEKRAELLASGEAKANEIVDKTNSSDEDDSIDVIDVD